MRAMVIDRFGGAEQIHERDLDVPRLGPDSVRIRVRSAGVNPVDFKLREGMLQDAIPFHFPIVLGWDVAGEVEAVGPAVVGLEVGTPVWAYCRKTEVAEGAYAELVTVPAVHVGHAPTSIDIADAGAIPLAGLAAWQAIDDALGLEAGETLLVGAASGGVGHLAVQIAVARGVRVLGTASPDNHDFVRSLGAEAVFDYARDDLEAEIRTIVPDGVDAAFDLLGGDNLELLRVLVREEGRIASLADPHPQGERSDITGRYVFVRPSSTGLDHLAALVDDGALRVEIAERFPLERVAEAHERLEGGHTRGKLVLTIPRRADGSAELRLELLDDADDAWRGRYNDALSAVWPEFAMTDEEFRHELAHAGPARRWTVLDAGAGQVVGALAVERMRWNADDAAPIAFALLLPELWSDGAYRTLLKFAAGFAREQGFEELRVLAWDREVVLRELLEGLPGWSEASREIDVGLDLSTATGWQRPAPDGVHIVSVAERPDLIAAAHACMVDAIRDVPGDEPEEVLPLDEWIAERARPSFRDEATFLAVSSDGEQVLGLAELEFPALLPDIAWHGFTAVARAARGGGIARALKAATIAYCRDAGLRQLRTENEERNAPMRHINASLGYSPVAVRYLMRGPTAPLAQRVEHRR